MRKFKELEIWLKGLKLANSIYQIATNLPDYEKYGLRSQITRAAVSIPSNIAEGCAKSSEKEFKLYLERALGSAFEIETQLLIIKKLDIIEEGQIDELITEVQTEQRMLGSFISSVKRRIQKPNTKHPKPGT